MPAYKNQYRSQLGTTSVSLPDKTKCAVCLKVKGIGFFSRKERDGLSDIIRSNKNFDPKIASVVTCMTCGPQTQQEICCTFCGEVKPRGRFSKQQRRNPDNAKCESCQEKINNNGSDTDEGDDSGGRSNDDDDNEDYDDAFYHSGDENEDDDGGSTLPTSSIATSAGTIRPTISSASGGVNIDGTSTNGLASYKAASTPASRFGSATSSSYAPSSQTPSMTGFHTPPVSHWKTGAKSMGAQRHGTSQERRAESKTPKKTTNIMNGAYDEDEVNVSADPHSDSDQEE